MKRTVTGNEPCTIDEAKAHIQGLEGITDYDAYISSLITVAREMAEAYTWRCITASTFELRLNSFDDIVKLPYPPAISVDSITYADTDDAEQTMSADDYSINNWDEPGKVHFDLQPSTNSKVGNIKITYKAGYTDVPVSIKQAILMMVRTLYDNREDMNNRTITELPFTSKDLLKPYRCFEF
jgi:uncharacterized phiE125 gp8 family phage protein